MGIVQSAKECIGFTCRISGAFGIFRSLLLRNRAIILVYHSPSYMALKRHLAFLSGRFSFISMDRLEQAISGNDFSSLPRFPVVLTFDDGHASNYLLLDLLNQYNVKPVIYCCSAIVDTNRRFWWKSGCRDAEYLKTLPVSAMRALLKKENGYEPEREYDRRDALSAAEIREMLPSVIIGSHTRFHPILPRCDDALSEQEIAGSKIELERLTGTPVRHFALPNGDGGPREQRFAKSAGYATVRTVRYGRVGPKSDPFVLRAVEVQHNASLNVLAAEIMGINAFLRRVLSGMAGRQKGE